MVGLWCSKCRTSGWSFLDSRGWCDDCAKEMTWRDAVMIVLLFGTLILAGAWFKGWL